MEPNTDLDQNTEDFDFDEEKVSEEVDTSRYYVNPSEMYIAYVEYKKNRDEALAQGLEYQITPYLAECIIKISNHLAYRWNFIGYSYRDEMIADGIEDCFRGFNSFDPTKSKQIFSYFTKCCFYAFVRRIQSEQKENNIRGKLIQNMDVSEIITQEEMSGDISQEFLEFIKLSNDYKLKPEKEKEKPQKQVKKESRYVELVFD